MYSSGLKTVKSILEASREDLLKVDGFKTKMADKLAEAIKSRKDELDCVTVMDASNTLGRGIGPKKIELIVTTIPAILQTRHIPTQAELLAVKGVEKTTASLFITNLPKYFEFVDDNDLDCMFEGKGTTVVDKNVIAEDYFTESEVVKSKDGDGKVTYSPKLQTYAGMKFVFTGFRNDALEKYLKTRGGSVSTSVSKNTTVVIRKDGKDKDSGKVKKAEELGVKIVNLQDFIKEHNIQL